MDMNRIDEVARLKKLDAEATRAPWNLSQIGNKFQILSDNPEFFIDFEDSDQADPELITEVRNALHWVLKVAGAFQPGDADRIDFVLLVLHKIGNDGKMTWYDREIEVLRRLLHAAQILEEAE